MQLKHLHGGMKITDLSKQGKEKKTNQRPARENLSNLRASPIISKKSLGKSMSFQDPKLS